jgi:hypothetical protein
MAFLDRMVCTLASSSVKGPMVALALSPTSREWWRSNIRGTFT